jgi:hypothetical protein
MQHRLVRVFLAALAFATAGCAHDLPTSPDSPQTVAQLSALNDAVDVTATTGLLGDMSDLGPLYVPSDNWWNLDVTNAPLDPGSASIISTVASYETTGGRLHPDFGSIYGMPYTVVDGSTPLVPVSFTYAAESDAGAPMSPAGYPIPAAATTNARYLEEQGVAGSNRHLLIYDRSRRIAFELFNAAYANGQWTAGSGAVFLTSINYRRPDGWTSADAAGLSITAGLLRYDEVYGAYPIRHAIRCSIRQVNGFVFPASHKGPTDANGYPLGMRFRLKSSFNISGYPAPLQKIFQAMKTYGLIVADRGSNMFVQGTMDARWDNTVLNPAFHSLHVTDFDVVQRGWNGSSGSTPPPPPPPPPVGDVALGLLSDLTPLGTLYAPADNWWNLRVDSAPLDPNSSSIIATIRSYESTAGRMHPDFTPSYGIPYCVVDNSTPLVPVSLGNTSESDRGAPGYPAGYPIPDAAKTNLRYIENSGGLDGDRHLLMYNRDNRMVYELSYASFNGSSWSAGYGAVFKVDSDYRRPEGWTSTDAAGLCVLAGLVRYDEVYGSAPINHAIRCSIKRTNAYVWPASHAGASDAGAPPLGMRLRLKASVDISGYPAPMRKIFQAMKTYGLIVADRGGNMYVQGTLDSRWDNSVLNPAFHSLNAGNFEVIQLGWKPTS